MQLGVDELLAPTGARRAAPLPVHFLPTGRRKGDRLLQPADPFAIQRAEARFRGAPANRATNDLRRALLAHYAAQGKS